MTSGTRTHGTSYNVSNTAGTGTVKNGFGSKVWSGVDYPVVKPTYKEEYRYLRTYSTEFVKGKAVRRLVSVEPRLIRRRIRPPKRARTEEHPYTMLDQYLTDVEFSWWTVDDAWNVRTYTGKNSGWFTPVCLFNWSANDDLALLGKLREAVAGSQFNAGNFLAEGHEALAMITNAATRIYWSYRAARHGDMVSATRYLLTGSDRRRSTGFFKSRQSNGGARETIASNWLELRYGWMPLLQDAHEGAQFLAHALSYPMQTSVRVSSKKLPADLGQIAPPYIAFLKHEAYERKTIKAVLREKDVVALSGLTDPASVLWEVMPYSFALDWFLPIGDYLSARGLQNSLVGLFVTTHKRYEYAEGLKFVGAASSWISDGREKGMMQKYISLDRSVSTTLPVPMPSFKPLSKVASWVHCANAVALLSQLKR